MTAHLSDDVLMDVLEGAGAPGDRDHVAGCEACRARVAEARAAFELATLADVPEPPAMYWEALRRNVGRRIAEEPRRRFGALWLAPVAAAAALVVVSLGRVGVAPTVAPSAATTLPPWSALPPVTEDPGLPVLADFASADGEEATLDEGRGLVAFLAELSDEERQTLAEALRAEGEVEL